MLHRLKSDKRRMNLDRKSGQAFLDHEIFTKGHRLDFHSGKTGQQFCSARQKRETGSSPL